jgi:hypothetical protein
MKRRRKVAFLVFGEAVADLVLAVVVAGLAAALATLTVVVMVAATVVAVETTAAIGGSSGLLTVAGTFTVPTKPADYFLRYHSGMFQLFPRRGAPIMSVIITASLLSAATVQSRPRPAGRQREFVANKTFGAGIMLGAPTGLTGKYFFNSREAIDFGFGGVRYYRNRSGFHVHADYLWHPLSLGNPEPFEIPLYVGVGARLFNFDDRFEDSNLALGLRVPVGIALDFNNVPLDIFLEFALVADFYVNYRDTVGFEVNGALGIRYWFN